MKLTLFAWLGSRLSSIFKKRYTEVFLGEDGRPGQVIITDKDGKVVFDSWNTEANPAPAKPEKPKTLAELDYDYLKARFTASSDVAAISRDRYDALLRLSFENEEVDAWLDQLYTRIKQPFIFVDACHGIGFVRS